MTGERRRTSWPGVSVVMPIRNEERHLRAAVGQVLGQDYPGELELVVALAPSKDRTEEIAEELAAEDHRVRVVTNPAAITPAGLNAAIAEAKHQVIVRVDGHGILSSGYIRRAVELLEETGAANVGGMMAARGETPFEQAVARAYTRPLGLGGGRFHIGGDPGPADSVYLGVFRRDVLERLGAFDETFVRAQDWELNYRIRQAGETIWFSPDLEVTYRPRPSLRDLARQFFDTGRWRRAVVRMHKGTMGLRYLAPPLAFAGCVVGVAAGLAGLVTQTPWLLLGFLPPAVYLAGVLVGAVFTGTGLPLRAKAWLPVAVVVMHLSWGAGFVFSPRSLLGERPPEPRPAR